MDGENSKESFNDGDILPERVEKFILNLESKGKITPKQELKLADKWLTWACSNQHMKIVSCIIPDGILPKDWWGKLLDCKVFTKFGPDDEIFDNNPEIRRKVARGNCFLELRSPSRSLRTFCVIRGITKFTGGMGDDDDRVLGEDLTWKSYFTKPVESVKIVVGTNKVNGESAHISGVVVDGVRYWVAGSKNVHMLFRDEEDLKKYDEAQQRFSIACEISQTWLEYTKLYLEDSIRLHEFLTNHKLTGNFEFLNPAHSHIEDLSHLERPQLVFITWTLLDLNNVLSTDEQLTVMSPDVATQIAKSFSLNTVDCLSIKPGSLDEHLYNIRLKSHREGEVLYFLDNDYNVIGLLKKKSVWYIIVRAIREKVKGLLDRFSKQNKKFSLTTEMAKISKRLNEIQQWLKLNEETIKSWKFLATEFVKWMLTLAEKDTLSTADVSEKFPTFWQRFLKETPLSDEVPVNHSVL